MAKPFEDTGVPISVSVDFFFSWPMEASAKAKALKSTVNCRSNLTFCYVPQIAPPSVFS